MLSGSPLSFSKSSGRVVVKALAGGLVQPLVQCLAFDLAALAPRVFRQDLGF